ncbi:MAG: hypothetical protein ACK56I_15430, partial [bacterium]
AQAPRPTSATKVVRPLGMPKVPTKRDWFQVSAAPMAAKGGEPASAPVPRSAGFGCAQGNLPRYA